jgi:hypothetical protein
MVSKASELLIWDSGACKSDSIDFIAKLQQIRKTAFAGIVIISVDPRTLPAAVGDLAVTHSVVTRFGENAIRDAVIDAIAFYGHTKGQATYVVITDQFPFWITLFHRLEPKGIVFVSSKDPTQSLEFSFLPENIPFRTLTWPSLVDGSSRVPEDETATLSSIHPIESVHEAEIPSDGEEVNGNASDDDFLPVSSHNPGIQPLDGVETWDIGLSSPGGTPPPEKKKSASPKKVQQQQARERTVQVQGKFHPLVEAMKSVGKVMILLSDLEAPLKSWSAKLNKPIESTKAYIAKAADAQLVVYDEATNYIRFRNRSLANSPIEYT